jgi:hypothetical protein
MAAGGLGDCFPDLWGDWGGRDAATLTKSTRPRTRRVAEAFDHMDDVLVLESRVPTRKEGRDWPTQ